MKILLFGEYSNVHTTLAEGLRALGHKVVVVSDGDSWKQYPRDIDLRRPSGLLGGLRLWGKTLCYMPRFTGYDVVQLINPLFVDLKAERQFPFFRFLKRHNKRIVLGAFGMDYYWVNENITRKPLRYSDFNIGDELRTDEPAMRERRDWLGTAKERLNRFVADEADAIVTGLYEYDVCYRPNFPGKTTFIPFPIKVVPHGERPPHDKTVIFAGISKGRSAYKGTDIMLRAARVTAAENADRTELKVTEGVPFAQYQRLLDSADIILDQLYSYTPAMNALEAMARGVVCVGGGEPENYEILGEKDLRPIVNVVPNEKSVYEALTRLVNSPGLLRRLQRESVEYVKRHHDHIAVAKRYEQLYRSLFATDNQ
ncbi:MAG: glycosyltransferase family 1 protein [Prevotella sp.]|nr:glycosyltransferase family 1 protein [Prevotella sp.]